MAIENKMGVHSREKSQVSDRTKTSAQQLAEFAKLDDPKFVVLGATEEVQNNKVKVLEE